MPRVFAIAAHPDDIEFLMAGTLLQLQEVGYELHYMTVADGCCGSQTIDADELAVIREAESREAAAQLGAEFHPSLCRDLEIFYDRETLLRLSAIVRRVAPEIVLTHALADYMEDHMHTARLAVTAAFSMGMPNFAVRPPTASVTQAVAVYHAQPFMNQDPLGKPVRPACFVDVTRFQSRKRDLLACHASQKEWLDVSQGIDSYLDTSTWLDRQVGEWSGRFERAEGWTQHATTGLSSAGWDPLCESLGQEKSLPAAS